MAGDGSTKFLKVAAYRAYQAGRGLSRLPVVRAVLPASLRARVQTWMLMRAIQGMPDRRYMEGSILPAVVGLGPRRVLDVGLESYTRHYARMYPPGCEYWTIDNNPEVARHAQPGRHIVGDVRDIASHFEPGSLDVVLMNGPFGYGIDEVADQERTIEAVRTVLAPGGRLLVGWNRGQDGVPVILAGAGRILDPRELEGIRAHFTHEAPGGLPAHLEVPGCSHIYDWFRLREAGGPS